MKQTEQTSERTILLSTGTMVSRLNGYDYRTALGEAAKLRDAGLCAGIELMMLKFYYDKGDSVVEEIQKYALDAPVVHCEKDVGAELSASSAAFAKGEGEEGEFRLAEVQRLFRLNCEIGQKAGCRRMVLHLWGGAEISDRYVEGNIAALPTLTAIAAEYGIRLLIENIPSAYYDPLSNWRRILDANGMDSGTMENDTEPGFIFDTRFGELHAQADEIFSDESVTRRIEHIHISDFGGGYRDFSALRPILHPGEGRVDFPHIASLLDKIHYSGTITLESPVNVGADLDIPKLTRTLTYLQALFCGK